jgi:DNA mismatch endonuclease (patch repair protein)
LGDIFTPEKRSEIMRKIKPAGSKQEIFIRKLVHSMGYRYRLHKKDLPGKPDLVFRKYKKVIFVNGCFWHGHEGCKRSALPTTNAEFWRKKITGNVERDKVNYERLNKLGWKILIVWQCEIKESEKEKLRKKISEFLEYG